MYQILYNMESPVRLELTKIDWKSIILPLNYGDEMIKLFTNEEFNSAGSRDLLKLRCEQCLLEFTKEKHFLQQKREHKFCSIACSKLSRRKKLNLECLECRLIVERTPSDLRKSSNTFCSRRCAAIYHNRSKTNPLKICDICKIKYKSWNKKQISCSLICTNKIKRNQYIIDWKNGLKSGGDQNSNISPIVRDYIFNKYESKCSLCGWSKINPKTNRIPLNIDHIDGDYSNNHESNLRLLCPNCHSLTPTYGSLNKGKGRPYRWRLKSAI